MSYANLTELRAAAAAALASLVTDEITAELVTAVLAASAHTTPAGLTNQHSAASLSAAVGTVALAEGLTLRNELLADILTRLADHEARIVTLEGA